jgi:hypothetical protein
MVMMVGFSKDDARAVLRTIVLKYVFSGIYYSGFRKVQFYWGGL